VPVKVKYFQIDILTFDTPWLGAGNFIDSDIFHLGVLA
jgi:hypothetical protein